MDYWLYFTSDWPGLEKFFFPCKLGKISLQRVDFPPVWDGFPYVFLYFFPPNHKISRQGASRFAYFFQACDWQSKTESVNETRGKVGFPLDVWKGLFSQMDDVLSSC